MRIQSATGQLPGTDPRAIALQARPLPASNLSDIASVSEGQDSTHADNAVSMSAVTSVEQPAASAPPAAELQQPEEQQVVQLSNVPLFSGHGHTGAASNLPVATDDTGQQGGTTRSTQEPQQQK